MVQIIDRPKSLAERLGSAVQQSVPGVAGALGQYHQNKRSQEQEQEQYKNNIDTVKRLTGEDYSGLSPELLKLAFKENLGQKSTADKLMQQQKEKTQPFENGLKTLQRMKEIKEKGVLGTKWNPVNAFHAVSPEGNALRSEYERLGKSLIGLASTVPIRNQAEFQVLAESLYDPSLRESEIEGILNGMERILKQGAGKEESTEAQGIDNILMPEESKSRGFSDVRHSGRQNEMKTGRFSKVPRGTQLTAEMARSILKHSKGDRKAAEQKARELGYTVEY